MSIQWALRMLPDLLPEDLLARLQSTSVDPYYVFPEAGNSMSVFDASCGEPVKVCMVLPAKCSPRIFLKNAILSSRRPSVARQSGKAGIAPHAKTSDVLDVKGARKLVSLATCQHKPYLIAFSSKRPVRVGSSAKLQSGRALSEDDQSLAS